MIVDLKSAIFQISHRRSWHPVCCILPPMQALRLTKKNKELINTEVKTRELHLLNTPPYIIHDCEIMSFEIYRFVRYKLWSLMVGLCSTDLTLENSAFCPHIVFMCFLCIWEQTAIISLYNINWLVCITHWVCLLRGTEWTFNIHQFHVLPIVCNYVFRAHLRTNSDYFRIQH